MTEAMDVLARKLKSDKRIIEIRDFGAGSKKLNTKRKVSDIYRISSSKGRKGRLLNRIVQFYKPGKILELGTSLGIGTISMRTALQNVEVVTVEACTNTRSLALENFEQVGPGGINSIESKFEHYLKNEPKTKFDLVYLDGHHDGQATIEYMNLLKDWTHNDTIFILDDIRWSSDMKSAFDQLCNSNEYHVSLDLFSVGILVKRPSQEKEHFVINW